MSWPHYQEHQRPCGAPVAEYASEKTYPADFGGGQVFHLLDRPNTFHLSPAGLALGKHLAHTLTPAELTGRILETGTGSGAIALLLRSIGATSITGLDISEAAIATARCNELANFGNSSIEFQQGFLFPEAQANSRYDLVVFNPPGWRAPSPGLRNALERNPGLDLNAMFFGDTTVLKFLKLLPKYLAPNGRAIVGLNSLVGIADVIQRMQETNLDSAAIEHRMLERHELPLVFYTEQWRRVQHSLVSQFERGRHEYSAVFINRGDSIHWFYEITEFRPENSALLTTAQPSAPPSPLNATAELGSVRL